MDGSHHNKRDCIKGLPIRKVENHRPREWGVIHNCDPCIWKEDLGHAWLHREFKVSPGYVREHFSRQMAGERAQLLRARTAYRGLGFSFQHPMTAHNQLQETSHLWLLCRHRHSHAHAHTRAHTSIHK